MKKTKKMLALALAASMVMGSSLVAIADDAATSGTGTVSGSGTVEGHVEKEVLNVVLPTVDADSSSAFAYTMDPERLIQGTEAAKYAEGTIFPNAASDTGVYFLTAANTYSNTSNIYQVINKSSCDIALSVKVKAKVSTGGKDIKLVADNAITTETDPALYLGLKVGNDTQEISTTEAEVKKTIAGSPTNFTVAVKTTGEGDSATKSYEYKEKTDASTWKAMNISMTGKVNNKTIASDTTAPEVDVTWSWEKAKDSDTASTDAVDYKEGPQISVTSSGLITLSNLTAQRNHSSVTLSINGATHDINVNPVDWNTSNWTQENGGTSIGQLGTEWMRWLTEETDGNITLTLNLTDGTSVSCTQTITK